MRRACPPAVFLVLLTSALMTPPPASAQNAQGAGAPPASPAFVVGDARPDAPELAARGAYAVGVRTLKVVNPDQLDILKVTATNANPRTDRPLTLEVWYPAQLAPNQTARTTYQDVLGSGPNDPKRPNTPFAIQGRAARDAAPRVPSSAGSGPYPLVIVSHGYPGSRYLLSYLCENLASKGYVVAAIDHTDSTHADKAGFASTLLNRPLDILFTLNKMAQLGAANSGSFLAGLVDANDTALIGYSMGGYGALNAAGAGFDRQLVDSPFVPGGNLAARQMGNPAFVKGQDSRIKAVVAFAPWGGDYAVKSVGLNSGGPYGFWDAAGLAGLKVPSLFIVGDKDDVSGYVGGVKDLFEHAVNSDRYLLVYQNAHHNVAPNPIPSAAYANFDDFMHYAEPAWDSARLNNINEHFVTAFLDWHLKGQADMQAYLNVIQNSSDGKFSREKDGTPKADDTYWKGFKDRTALGMELYHRAPK